MVHAVVPIKTRPKKFISKKFKFCSQEGAGHRTRSLSGTVPGTASGFAMHQVRTAAPCEQRVPCMSGPLPSNLISQISGPDMVHAVDTRVLYLVPVIVPFSGKIPGTVASLVSI